MAQLIDFGDDPISASSVQGGSCRPSTPLNFGQRLLVHSLTDSWTSADQLSDPQGRHISAASSIEIPTEAVPSATAYHTRSSPLPLGDALHCANSSYPRPLGGLSEAGLSMWPIPDKIVYVSTANQRHIPLRFFWVDEDTMKDTIADILLMDSQGTGMNSKHELQRKIAFSRRRGRGGFAEMREGEQTVFASSKIATKNDVIFKTLVLV